MCEINHKRKQLFALEFFTNAELTDERWHELVIGTCLRVEQEANRTGEIRVHVHEVEEVKDGSEDSGSVQVR